MDSKQTRMAFMDEGGMIDDGATTDSVSGNEVPAGSLEGEVRDDIDAKLSAGEFVIPADAVQFYGVDKLEKMIQKAKTSLEEMEANGRIGGEEEIEDEELPFTDDELVTVEENAPTNKPVVKMAEGGAVFNPQDYAYGGTTGVQTRMYINADGSKRAILFINGEPTQEIPEGFLPDTPENRATFNPDTTETKVQDVSDNAEDHWKDSANEENGQNVDPKEWEEKDFQNYIDQQGFVNGLTKASALVPGGVLIGAAVKKGNEYTGRKAYEELQERIGNEATPPEEKERLKAISDNWPKEESTAGKVGGILGGGTGGILGNALSGQGTGVKFIDDFLGFGKGQPTTPSTNPSPVTTPSTTPSTSTSSGGGGSAEAKGQASLSATKNAPQTSTRPSSKPSNPSQASASDFSQGGGQGTGVSKDVRDAVESAGGYSGGGPSGGFAKGGFVAPKKTKKRNYSKGGFVARR